MSTNVIKQTIVGGTSTHTIKQIVRSSERGATGPQGIPGNAATVTAGNAYAVEPGQAPAVINTGTPSDAVLDFYIPRGETGIAPIIITDVDPGEGSPLEDNHFIAVYNSAS